MNANTACASTEFSWDTIKWKLLSKQIRKLQMRIVKAQKTGRFNKVKILQRLITNSFAAKALAIKRITQNKGKSTPGIDKVLFSTSNSKMKAISQLKTRGYKASPLRRILIPKKNRKELRPLGIPTMKDRAMQALYLMALDPVSETNADNPSYGFRRGRSTHDAIEHCFKIFARKTAPEWVLEGDIKGCFDNISHEWLMENIPINKKVLKEWLESGIIFKEEWIPTKAGTPQGSVISASLANMTLDGIDRLLKSKFKKQYTINHKQYCPKINFVRYADDFIISAESKETLINDIIPMLEKFLKQRGLELSKTKTKITHISEGFDFLGQTIRKFKDKLIIKPSKDSLKSIAQKINNIIKKNQSVKQENLIHMLNPVIRGWCNYHKHAVASDAFYKLDHIIWVQLWKWALKRHRRKGKKWVKEKYFKDLNGRRWTFATIPEKEKNAKDKETKHLKLLLAGDFKITRHKMIKMKYNPYDVEWDVYHEEKMGFKLLNNERGKEKLIKIWRSQGQLCPKCGENIDKSSGWCIHDEDTGNKNKKVMLHPECHKNLH